MVRRLVLIWVVAIVLCRPVMAQLVVVVNPSNPVSMLTSKEVKKIFMGRMGLFPGSELKPLVVDLPESDPLYRAFYEKFVGITVDRLRRYRASYLFTGQGVVPKILPTGEEVKRFVQNTLNGVGYLDSTMLDGTVKPVWVMPDP